MARCAIAFYGMEYLKDLNVFDTRLVLEQIYLEILLKSKWIKEKVDELRITIRSYGLRYLS